VPEIMVASLQLSALLATVDAALEGKRAVVIGPGFGLEPVARDVVERVVGRSDLMVVVDADALTHFAGRPEALASSRPAILTPHPGEAARLLGGTAREVEADRFRAARTLADRAKAVVVLKGACTLVAAPGRPVVVNPTGTPALATAGSGDTLSGIIGALACTLPAFEAAWTGAYLHGLAADRWSEADGDRGLLASEIADGIPPLLAALAREHTSWPV
jgi:NAD(P)H-hydrate epimerase